MFRSIAARSAVLAASRRGVAAPAARWAAGLSTGAKSKPFPSITLTGEDIRANGVFAEAQLAYLEPHPTDVKQLDDALAQANLGVVAHYYMDPELQGILAAIEWPHVFVADSLAMGDAAVKMATDGCTSVACLGVDFMAESVRATLDAQGFPHVPVYRLKESDIGCSLAASAETPAYDAWLHKAMAPGPPALHVVYINTSLQTKAQAQAVIPTVTCTSSNVVATILQAFAQVPDLRVYYGPDTYMGENLVQLFQRVAELPDAQIRAIHPEHDAASVRNVVDNLHVFPQGNCVVHHMFGRSVAERVRDHYGDALLTAHLEVPGEMFQLANEAAHRGRGAVGSTKNILDFIVDETAKAGRAGASGKLEFVLGTEAGMVTPIVRQVQAVLRDSPADLQVEIVFPVAAEAVTPAEGANGAGAADGAGVLPGLSVLPGVSGGEGCSAAGGCATCPFMKMNTLEGLLDVTDAVFEEKAPQLEGYLSSLRATELHDGQQIAKLGAEPILQMRHLMRTGKLSPELIADVRTRTAPLKG